MFLITINLLTDLLLLIIIIIIYFIRTRLSLQLNITSHSTLWSWKKLI